MSTLTQQQERVFLLGYTSFDLKGKYLSKEEISKQTGVSVNTLQNWLGAVLPTSDQVRVKKGGKKLYRLDYVRVLFEKAERIEEFERITHSSDLDGEPQASKVYSRTIDNLAFEQLIAAKDETISQLKNETVTLKEQILIKDAQIASVTQALAQSQFLLKQEQEEKLTLTQTVRNLEEDEVKMQSKIEELASKEHQKALELIAKEVEIASLQKKKRFFWF